MQVTVGIPTFNRAGLLRTTMESVLSQTFADFRLVVSDNASTDDTGEVVASFRDERIDYVRSDRNVGAIANLNRLVALADTEFVMLLPDDDVLYPNHLSAVIQTLQRSESIGLVHTAFDIIDSESRVIAHRSPLKSREPVTIETGDQYLERSMTSSWPICFSSAVYRTRAIVEADGFREAEEPFSDLPLWMRLALDWDFGYVAEPLAGFRLHPETVTMQIGAEAGALAAPQQQASHHAQVRFQRRAEFLDQSGLPDERANRLRSLSTMQFLVETASRGAPWSETTRTLLSVLRAYPRIAARPPIWRLAAGQLGARRLRASGRALASRLRR